MGKKNVTLSLPEPLLREFRVYAAVRNESMTGLLTDAIQNMLGHDKDRDRARPLPRTCAEVAGPGDQRQDLVDAA